jgi:hypothetical protein
MKKFIRTTTTIKASHKNYKTDMVSRKSAHPLDVPPLYSLIMVCATAFLRRRPSSL